MRGEAAEHPIHSPVGSGFSLHPASKYVNYFRATPRRSARGHYPSSVVASPHLFSRLAVPDLCIGP